MAPGLYNVPMRHPLPRRVVPPLLAVLGAVATGCQAPPQAPSIGPTGTALANDAAIRAGATEYAARFSSQVELTAARIADATSDRQVRRAAATWALRANEETLASLTGRAPAASLIDLWVLAAQFRAHAEGPAAATAWGEFQPAVLETAVALEAEAHQNADQLGGRAGTEDAHTLVAQWAAENPLREKLARPASDGFWARYRKEIDPLLDTPAADISGAATATSPFTEQLARQVAMRAALILEERHAGSAPLPETPVRTIAAFGPRIVGAGPHAGAASAERLHLETLDRLDALVADTINAINQQRTAAVGEVAAIVESASVQAAARHERLVSLVFWRAAALLGLAFLAVVAAFLVASPRRRRGVRATLLAPPSVRRPTGRTLTAGRA